MNLSMNETAPKRWYREPWPWLLMLGPGVVIVAGIVTAWLAVSSNDGLVTDDYYKQGLAVGQTIAQSRLAEEMGVKARVTLGRDLVRVRLEANPGTALPDRLRVSLSHPTRAGLDQQMQLAREGDAYAAKLLLPASGHWLLLLEDEARTWRLMGSLMLPTDQETVIGTQPEVARKGK